MEIPAELNGGKKDKVTLAKFSLSETADSRVQLLGTEKLPINQQSIELIGGFLAYIIDQRPS